MADPRIKRRLYIFYTFLFLYAIVSFGQYFYFKKEIRTKEEHITNLNQILDSPNTKLEEATKIDANYKRITARLDSLLNSDTELEEPVEEIVRKIITPVETIAEEPADTTKPKPIEITEVQETESEEIVSEEKKEIKKTAEELRREAEKLKKYFFKEITGIYANLKNPRPVRQSDRYIWIEIISDYGSYKNPLWKMIRGISINGVYVPMSDVKEQLFQTSSGYITTYYIELQIPREVVFYQRNQVILAADKDYIEWFFVK